MQNTNDGGYAFPQALGCGENSGSFVGCEGMSLRDYFAAKALPAIIDRASDLSTAKRVQDAANDAYIVADAMLRAREQKDK